MDNWEMTFFVVLAFVWWVWLNLMMGKAATKAKVVPDIQPAPRRIFYVKTSGVMFGFDASQVGELRITVERDGVKYRGTISLVEIQEE